MNSENRDVDFDYRALRLLVGLIAFLLPVVVTLISCCPLSSISASYYTAGRDALVGMLFIVGAFLWAYNGHTPAQGIWSSVAALAAVTVAVCPASCDLCGLDAKAVIHYIAGAALFSILAYFCFGPFRKDTRGKPGKRGLRSRIYLVCGLVMAVCIVFMFVTNLALPQPVVVGLRLGYWAETVALGAFGVAWFTAGKWVRLLVDEDERLKLFGKKG
jgi:hypothetical protein